MDRKYMIEVVDKAIDTLSQPDVWIQGSLCTKKGSNDCLHPKDPEANCFCLIGAIAKNAELPDDCSFEKFLAPHDDPYIKSKILDNVYSCPEVMELAEFIAKHENHLYITNGLVYRFNDRAKHVFEVIQLLEEFKRSLLLEEQI